jgi:two-component system, NtrC family, response regulator AtoC
VGRAGKILIVENDSAMADMLSDFLSEKGFTAAVAQDGAAALDQIRKDRFDVILSDVVMPNMDGIELLRRLRELKSDAAVIMMSAYGTIDNAVEAMKLGAYDYIAKPFRLDEIILTIGKVQESRMLRDENVRLKRELAGKYTFHDIITKNDRMHKIFQTIKKVSGYSTGILIMGESGTGKELVARAIHYESNLQSGPFVAVNLAAIPETLLESELFGHVKGAFTDAVRDKPGLFEEANRGTLFLDEIGELPVSLQVKLLRALQEGEVRRVGATGSAKVSVRIIAATAKDLEQEIKNGSFRDDLYWRLNVISLKLPPLRERTEDIPLLVEHFIGRFNAKLGLSTKGIDREALSALMDYRWPGNIRELENCMERALILSDSEMIRRVDLPHQITEKGPMPAVGTAPPSSASFSIKVATHTIERRLISDALAATDGNLTKAAKLLEISYRALLYKIKEYNIR